MGKCTNYAVHFVFNNFKSMDETLKCGIESKFKILVTYYNYKTEIYIPPNQVKH